MNPRFCRRFRSGDTFWLLGGMSCLHFGINSPLTNRNSLMPGYLLRATEQRSDGFEFTFILNVQVKTSCKCPCGQWKSWEAQLHFSFALRDCQLSHSLANAWFLLQYFKVNNDDVRDSWITSVNNVLEFIKGIFSQEESWWLPDWSISSRQVDLGEYVYLG